MFPYKNTTELDVKKPKFRPSKGVRKIKHQRKKSLFLRPCLAFLASREKEGDEKTLHGNPMTGNLYWFETKLREMDKGENAAFRKLIKFSSQAGFRNLT